MEKPETKFQREILKSILFYFPNSDFSNIVDTPKIIKGKRFSQPKKYDIEGALNGVPYAIELKISKSMRINRSMLRESQLDGLQRAVNAGRKALVITKHMVKPLPLMSITRFEDLHGSHKPDQYYQRLAAELWDIRELDKV